MDKIYNIQKEIAALVKNQENPFFKSKYFDVNQIIEHLKPLLEKNELVVLQPLSHIEGKMALKTEVYSKDGTVLISSITPLPEASDAQKYGSAITYFRRYSLQSLFLLQAEDDDGNNAKKSIQTEAPKTTKAIHEKAVADYSKGEDPFN